MKQFKLYQYIFLIFTITFFSCQDIENYNVDWNEDNTSSGAPTIISVTPVNKDSLISAGIPSQLVAIHGTNLVGVKSIYFDDVQADLSTAYVKASQIVIPIPETVPDIVINTLKITTDKGDATYNFGVTVPSLVLTGLYNEYALAGDTAEIIGKYFDAYKLTPENGKVYFGSDTLSIVSATSTSIKFLVPQNASNNTVVMVGSKSARLSTPVKVPGLYKETGFKLIDCNDPTTYNAMTTGSAFITDGTKSGDPTPNSGKYMRLNGTYASYSWTPFFVGTVQLTSDYSDIVNNKSNYMIEFEVNNNKNVSLSGGNILIKFAGGTLTWNPASSGVALNTLGRWKTVSFSMSIVVGVNPIVGSNAVSVISQPTSARTIDASFANFRIVSK